MFRVTIREWFLITALTAVSLAFWNSRNESAQLCRENKLMEDTIETLAASLEAALDKVPTSFVPIYADDLDVQSLRHR